MEVTRETRNLDRQETARLIAQGCKPVAVDPSGAGTFYTNDIVRANRKPLPQAWVAKAMPYEAAKALTPLQRKQAIDDLLDDVIGSMRDMFAGRTRTLSGREAGIALRLGVKPVKQMGGDALQFRVADLNAAAAKLGTSEVNGLALESWWFLGRGRK